VFLHHYPISEAELIAQLIAGGFILVSPFVAVGLVVGYVAGRFIKDPWSAAFVSGLISLLSFWASVVAAIAVFVGNGQGAGVAAFVSVIFFVGLGLTPVFVALAYVTYRNRRAKLSRAPEPPG